MSLYLHHDIFRGRLQIHDNASDYTVYPSNLQRRALPLLSAYLNKWRLFVFLTTHHVRRVPIIPLTSVLQLKIHTQKIFCPTLNFKNLIEDRVNRDQSHFYFLSWMYLLASGALLHVSLPTHHPSMFYKTEH